MSSMPAVQLTVDRRIVLTDVPVPARRSDQVIVDVDLCGICGSDLHAPDLPQVYRGGFTMGHEASGAVCWVGSEVEGWQVGQRVALNPNGNVDGTCAQCRAGRTNFCYQATMETALGMQMDGALAPQMAVFPGSLRALPDGMSRIAAGWVEPTATALRAVRRAGDIQARRILVTGGGPIGQLAIRICQSMGAAHVTLMEPTEIRRAAGQASGADECLHPDEARRNVSDLHADVVLEASGNAQATSLGLDALEPDGTLVVVGGGPGNTVDPLTVLLKELSVIGSFTYVDEDFDDAVTMLADGTVSVEDLTSAVVPVTDALEAFESLRSASTMKVLIAPNA